MTTAYAIKVIHRKVSQAHYVDRAGDISQKVADAKTWGSAEAAERYIAKGCGCIAKRSASGSTFAVVTVETMFGKPLALAA